MTALIQVCTATDMLFEKMCNICRGRVPMPNFRIPIFLLLAVMMASIQLVLF